MAPKGKTAKPAEQNGPGDHQILMSLIEQLGLLVTRIEELEAKVFAPKAQATIQKTEQVSGELPPPMKDDSGWRMNDADKIRSMTNAVKILPPNMIKEGRHQKENVQAICGFPVTEEMMDEVYSKFSHSD